MSDTHDHAHHHHDAAAPFSAAEIEHFHAEDYAAGKAVVALMVGIFCIGIFIYTIVALACRQP